MEIRNATKSDVPDLVRLNDEVQRQHAEQYPNIFKYPVNSLEVTQFFLKIIASEKNAVILAFDDQEVLAYLYYEVQQINENAFKFYRPRYYIHQVQVDAKKRRSAVATALFRWVARAAQSEEIDQIELDTYMLNEGAHRFFEAEGFVVSKLTYTKS